MPETNLLDAHRTFSSMSHILDTRILRALADMGFAQPTLVQSKAIPIALEGRDILARARTGSGKTAAYCIPVLQKLLNAKSILPADDPARSAVRALILVPTRELSEQVTSVLKDLTAYLEKEVLFVNLAAGTTAHLQRILLSDKPDLVVATPHRIRNLLQSQIVSLASLESLVIDEADLVLSFGHDEDMRLIFGGDFLPKVFQSFLMSATMTKDVEQLKGLVLRNPAILRLEEDEDDTAGLTQFAVRCSEVDKFLLTYVILKLKLVKGKSIIFVNDVDRCYRLKLFLEQFSINSCVLNSELPLNSRIHIVQEFNQGVYDYIIATDESSDTIEPDTDDEGDKEKEDVETNTDELTSTQRDGESGADPADVMLSSESSTKRKRASSPTNDSKKPAKQRKRQQNNDKEYGVMRGVDFIDVACVLNFDLPTSSRAYTHRVGRTARAGRTGMSLSYVVLKEEWGKNKVVGCLASAKRDEIVFKRIEEHQAARGSKIKDYKFDMKQVEAFRYRMEDALRAVTKVAIKEARLKELKAEILKSDKLKAHFEDNPMDLDYLRHDKPLHPTRIQPHMKHVPKYLLPRTAANPATTVEGDGAEQQGSFRPFRKNRTDRARGRGRGRDGGRDRGGRKKADPLKKFGR